MSEKTAELTRFLADCDEVLAQAVQSVPAEERERQPSPGRWSVAEILEHLMLVERRVAGVLQQLVDRAIQQQIAPDTDTSSVLAQIDLGRVLDRSNRIEALEAARPRGALSLDAAAAGLRAARNETLRVLENAAATNLGRVQFDHFRFGPLNGYQWVAFLGGHEQRHAAQIREIAESLQVR